MTLSLNRRYLPEVDHLRAFAATLVLSYHGLQLFGAQLAHGTNFNPATHWLYQSNAIITIIEEGHTGVSLFIVLSGFILSLGAIGNTVDYKRFLIARILRIYPMLVVCLLVATSISPSSIITVLTSLSPVVVSGGASGTFAALFWAVAVEFECYLIFPFLIAFSNQRGSQFLVQVILVALVMRLLAVFADGANPRDLSYWTTLGRVDQFCIGMIAARFYIDRNLAAVNAFWFLPAAFVTGAALWQFNRLGGWPLVSTWKIAWPIVEGFLWAWFIVTYIAAGRLLPHWLSRLGAKLGEISYSMYLIHFAVVFAIIRGGFYLRPTGDGYNDALATTFLVALPTVIAIAALTYHTIELPFLNMRPKYINRTATPERSSDGARVDADAARQPSRAGPEAAE